MPISEEINLKVNIEFKPERLQRASEAVMTLGKRLAALLDDDQFNNLEPELHAIAACLASASADVTVAEPALQDATSTPTFETLVQRAKNDVEGLRDAVRVLTPVWQKWIGEVLDELVLLRAQADVRPVAAVMQNQVLRWLPGAPKLAEGTELFTTLPAAESSGVIDLNDSQLLDELDRLITVRDLRWVANTQGNPGIGTVSGFERHGIRDAIRALLVFMRQSPDHRAEAAVEPSGIAHPDDVAVDRFAAAMKEKLAKAREKGRGGWEQCDPVELSIMLREHVEKGDPRDVANFCMFLWSLGKPISDVALPYGKRVAPAPLHLGASLMDRTLHLVAMRHEDGVSTVIATAELEVDTLTKTDCHVVMAAEPVVGEPAGYFFKASRLHPWVQIEKENPNAVALYPSAKCGQQGDVSEGWKLVPEEPTQAMRDAGFECIPGVACALAVNVWKAMFAAAPTYRKELAKGCTRSHPHEHMDAACQHKSEEARAGNLSQQTGLSK